MRATVNSSAWRTFMVEISNPNDCFQNSHLQGKAFIHFATSDLLFASPYPAVYIQRTAKNNASNTTLTSTFQTLKLVTLILTAWRSGYHEQMSTGYKNCHLGAENVFKPWNTPLASVVLWPSCTQISDHNLLHKCFIRPIIRHPHQYQ